MRHDTHFVDQLARPEGEAIGRLIPIEDIEANPHQPRRSLGELAELAASIREKGILEPLLVRMIEGRGGRRYQIIAGERRYRAAVEAGLDELPCIVRESSDAETMELALIENLQRKDLTPFEEADGLLALAESHGYTHEKMAEKLGKSRSSITETLSLAAMPEEVRQVCRLADIQSKSLLIQVVRQSDTKKMMALLERFQKEGVSNRKDARQIAASRKKAAGRPRNFVFRYQPKEKSFRLALQFRRSEVDRGEIIRTLRAIIEELSGTD
jgi:ParB family chromosome partitioning protein